MIAIDMIEAMMRH